MEQMSFLFYCTEEDKQTFYVDLSFLLQSAAPETQKDPSRFVLEVNSVDFMLWRVADFPKFTSLFSPFFTAISIPKSKHSWFTDAL